MLDDPRVNFAVSKRGHGAGVNHLGIQAETATELDEMNTRLHLLGADPVKQSGSACCYAKSDKYWITDPQGLAWESFHTLAEAPAYGGDTAMDGGETAAACCIPLFKKDTAPSDAACCVPHKQTAAGEARAVCC